MPKVNVKFLRQQLRQAHTEIEYLKEQLNKANQKPEMQHIRPYGFSTDIDDTHKDRPWLAVIKLK